jgi:hypothetical protein
VEAALSIYLESFATTLGSREQLAIAEFAEALLVLPKTLAVNAAKVRPARGPWLGCSLGQHPEAPLPVISISTGWDGRGALP